MSSIEWTGKTWNPATGCTKVSPGCRGCYFLEDLHRLSRMLPHRYDPGGRVMQLPETLSKPLTWKKPSLVFVNSMGDFFHEDITTTYIEAMLDVMREASHHVFQILTKRGERLARLGPWLDWPENVWMGVSVESSESYTARGDRPTDRVAQLQSCGAQHLFLSAEPLVGPVGTLDLKGIGWVIVGGESGKKARFMDLAWARDVVAQCEAASVPVFVKQLGRVWAKSEKARLKREKPEGWQQACELLGGSHAKGGRDTLALWPDDLRAGAYPPQMLRLLWQEAEASG